MEKGSKRDLLLTVSMIGLLIITLFLAVRSSLGTELRDGLFWGEYYTIITSDPLKAEAALDGADLPFLSLGRSEVSFNAIPDMETIPLKSVTDRLNRDDPRLDPYMLRAADLFKGSNSGEEKELIYVESDSIDLFSLHRLLKASFSDSGEDWSISGFDPSLYIRPLFLYAAAGLVLFLLFSSALLRLIPAYLAWIPFLFFGGYPAVSAAVVSLYAASSRKNPLLSLIPPAAALVLLTFSGQMVASDVTLLLTPLVPSLFLLTGAKGLAIPKKETKNKPLRRKRVIKKIRFSKPEHRLFDPVTIMDSVPTGRKSPQVDIIRTSPLWGKAACLLLVLLSSLMTFLEKEPESHLLPLPTIESSGEWSLEHIAGTFEKGDFTSPGDYLAHRAYQEGFLYKRDWTYPSPDKPLTFPRFETTDTGFSKNYEILEDYSGKWFQERISLLKNNNPAKLLFSTVTPIIVEKKSDQLKTQPFLLLNFSFFMLVLWLLFFIYKEKTAKTSKSTRKKLLRRNEQVA